MSFVLKYLSGYPEQIQNQIRELISSKQLATLLRKKYPTIHTINDNRSLQSYVMGLKNRYIKKSEPLSKVEFDKHIHVIKNALGTHSYVSRVQGKKVKRKNEIRISTLFKKCPEEFLNMIVVHELAHLKEKEHNKAFYQLCEHMLPNYHQIEFDLRLYLTQLELSPNDLKIETTHTK
ncbi:YgjP-like metallopeptidase domain-containing protein [Colwelliaceae bacterium 6471]